MPLTPFIGLSVFIHLCIILWHKIFNRGRSTSALIFRKNTKFMNFGVTSIIVVVFAFVAISATLLVKASVEDGNSSINLTQRYLIPASVGLFHDFSYAVSDKEILLSTKANNALASSQMIACAGVKELVSNYDSSIVDYLKAQQQDYSFEARTALASTMGMNNYVGSSPQNVLLLEQMISSQFCKT